jgi:hypothetical protein
MYPPGDHEWTCVFIDNNFALDKLIDSIILLTVPHDDISLNKCLSVTTASEGMQNLKL